VRWSIKKQLEVSKAARRVTKMGISIVGAGGENPRSAAAPWCGKNSQVLWQRMGSMSKLEKKETVTPRFALSCATGPDGGRKQGDHKPRHST